MALPTPSLLLLSLGLQCENVRMMQMVRGGAVSGSANAIAPIAFLRTLVGECKDNADGEVRVVSSSVNAIAPIPVLKTAVGECEDDVDGERRALSGSINTIDPIPVLRIAVEKCEDNADGEWRGCQWLSKRHRSYCFP